MALKKIALRFAQEWRDSLKFVDITYSDFIDFLSSTKEKMYFSEKVDGELNTLVYDKGMYPFFLTKSGIVRVRDYPVLREYKEILDKIKNINNIVIAGELKAIHHNDIHYQFNRSQSIIQTGDVNKVRHFVFDIYRLNGKQIRADFPTLEKMFKTRRFIKIPRWKYGNIDEFQNMWKQIVGVEKGEGIVAFSPSKPRLLYRIKHVMTADVVVVGAGNINEKAWAKGQIGYLKLAILNKDNNFILTSKVGTGFTKQIRINLFDYVNKNKLEIKDGEVWIPPDLIIEVKYRRYRFTTSLPLLKYNGKKYIKIGSDDGVMMDQTSFIRFRKDKRLDYKDLSINQFPIR